ncbi:MAG: EamA family transporter RarD [Pararhodobacter sp.]|nr:EamA family transporter RarD [Pararhodobacter sp.]
MSAQDGQGDSVRGFLLALAAYLIWGALPLYMHLLNHIPLPEIVAHRVLWSVPIALAVLVILRRTADLRAAITAPRMLAMAGLTAALVSINWGVYLYAIQANRVIDAALGYFINPLFSIFLGAVVLRERLSRPQWAAVGLAGLAVALLSWEARSLPLVSLALTASWGFYALFKRALPIGPNQGFTLEVILLTPPALGYLVWLAMRGELRFATGGFGDSALLIGAGVMTAVPLMLYANGAKGLRLTTIALMQYIAPTFIFLVAVFVFGEPFEGAKRVAFPLIWAALVLYSTDLYLRRRR